MEREYLPVLTKKESNIFRKVVFMATLEKEKSQGEEFLIDLVRNAYYKSVIGYLIHNVEDLKTDNDKPYYLAFIDPTKQYRIKSPEDLDSTPVILPTFIEKTTQQKLLKNNSESTIKINKDISGLYKLEDEVYYISNYKVLTEILGTDSWYFRGCMENNVYL